MTVVDADAAARVFDLYRASLRFGAVRAFCRLGVADAIAAVPRTPDQLARDLDLDAELLARLLRFLEADGWIQTQRADGALALSAAGQVLAKASVPSAHAMVAAPGSLDAVAGLERALRTGRAPFAEAMGDEFWTWLDAHPDAARGFVEKMSVQSRLLVDRWGAAIDWPDEGLVVDVGGGDGGLLRAVLRTRPKLRGCIVERPPVAEVARRALAAAGLDDRVTVEEVDFRVAVPAGGDVYVLARVLHDWGDDDARHILEVVGRAATRPCRLRLIEMVDSVDAALSDLTMLLLFGGGKERTAEELDELLRVAGWEPTRTIDDQVSRMIEAELRR